MNRPNPQSQEGTVPPIARFNVPQPRLLAPKPMVAAPEGPWVTFRDHLDRLGQVERQRDEDLSKLASRSAEAIADAQREQRKAEAALSQKDQQVRDLAAVLEDIASRPAVEDNPDGRDQAAETMQLIAREAVEKFGPSSTPLQQNPEVGEDGAKSSGVGERVLRWLRSEDAFQAANAAVVRLNWGGDKRRKEQTCGQMARDVIEALATYLEPLLTQPEADPEVPRSGEDGANWLIGPSEGGPRVLDGPAVDENVAVVPECRLEQAVEVLRIVARGSPGASGDEDAYVEQAKAWRDRNPEAVALARSYFATQPKPLPDCQSTPELLGEEGLPLSLEDIEHAIWRGAKGEEEAPECWPEWLVGAAIAVSELVEKVTAAPSSAVYRALAEMERLHRLAPSRDAFIEHGLDEFLRLFYAAASTQPESPGNSGRRDKGIPDDYWREVPCGHPPDPVAMYRRGRWPICHCGCLLDTADLLPAPPDAPGPLSHCLKCGCYVAIPPVPGNSGGERLTGKQATVRLPDCASDRGEPKTEIPFIWGFRAEYGPTLDELRKKALAELRKAGIEYHGSDLLPDAAAPSPVHWRLQPRRGSEAENDFDLRFVGDLGNRGGVEEKAAEAEQYAEVKEKRREYGFAAEHRAYARGLREGAALAREEGAEGQAGRRRGEEARRA